MKHFVRPSAKDDIPRQYRYYLLKDAFDAADRFLDAVDNSIADLCRMPETGAPRAFQNPALAGLRCWPVNDFEDLRIYYVIQNDILRVVRILHGKRDIKAILEKEKDDGARH